MTAENPDAPIVGEPGFARMAAGNTNASIVGGPQFARMDAENPNAQIATTTNAELAKKNSVPNKLLLSIMRASTHPRSRNPIFKYSNIIALLCHHFF